MEDRNQVVNHVVKFNENFYKENHKWGPRLDVLNLVSILRGQNAMLEGRISESEVLQAIETHGEDKASGMDEFPLIFFEKC